jgi:hypothetical protein
LLFCKPEDLDKQLTIFGGKHREINLMAFRAGLRAHLEAQRHSIPILADY